MINEDGGGQFLDFVGGDTAVMRGDIELMGSSTRENPEDDVFFIQSTKIYNIQGLISEEGKLQWLSSLVF